MEKAQQTEQPVGQYHSTHQDLQAQGARPLYVKRTRVFTVSSFQQHGFNINSRGSIISCGGTWFIENISVLRLRRITQRQSMVLQGKAMSPKQPNWVLVQTGEPTQTQTWGGA